MNKYMVQIFDGTHTTFYTTESTDKYSAMSKIRGYHTALGGEVKKISATPIH